MIKAIIAVVAVLGAFMAGLAGIYFAMPTIAPAKVEKAEAHLDSLAFVDSLAHAYNKGLLPDSLGYHPDSTAVIAAMMTPPDTLAETPADEEAAEDEVSVEENEAEVAAQTALQDSLVMMKRQFEQLQREQQQLFEQVEQLKGRVQEQQLHSEEIQELSGTLAKLEDKELAGVVAQLDMEVLEALYEQASARNRKRLLQAMPAEVAAGFVRRLVRPSKTAAVTQAMAPPDTAAAPPVANSEPVSSN